MIAKQCERNVWMFNWNLNNVKRVFGGKKLKLTCLACNKKATFYEATLEDRVAAYFVLELYKRTKRVMQCGECLGVTDYYEMFPDEKAHEAQHREETKRKEAEARSAEDLKRKTEQELEAKRREEERLKQEAAELKKRAEAKVAKDKEVDDELAQLKKKLGKD